MPDPQSRRPVSVVAATVRSANAVPPSSQPCSAQQSPFRLRHNSNRPPRNRCPAVIAAIAIRRIDLFPSFDSPGRDRTTSARSARPPHRSGSFVAAVPPHLPSSHLPATALRSRPSRTPRPAHPKLDTPNSLPAPPIRTFPRHAQLAHPTHTRQARPQPHASPHATRPAGHEKSRPGRDGLFHRIENRRDQ